MGVLVPDYRGLERNFHDVTIVDLDDLPDVSLSLDLSMLRRQWPAMVLRHMVWLQQDLDTMCAEARKRFRNARPGKCLECHKWIKCDMYRHVATYHLDLAQLWRCPSAERESENQTYPTWPSSVAAGSNPGGIGK